MQSSTWVAHTPVCHDNYECENQFMLEGAKPLTPLSWPANAGHPVRATLENSRTCKALPGWPTLRWAMTIMNARTNSCSKLEGAKPLTPLSWPANAGHPVGATLENSRTCKALPGWPTLRWATECEQDNSNRI